MNNLELWHKVEKTNPKYTKKANVRGNNITSIAPQFQIMNVTEQFGVYGEKWGFKEINLDYTLSVSHGLVIFKAVFFFPKGEFPIVNAISLFMDNAKTKIDDNFANQRYLDEVTKEFTPKESIDNTRFEKALEKIKDGSYTVEKLKATFELTELQNKSLMLL